jgi:hypothetical protein
MKYSLNIEINKPIEMVTSLYKDRSNDKLWMKGFLKKTPIEGEEGNEGAKCKVEFKMGKRHFVMEEEIVKINLPEEYTTTYTTPKVFNVVKSSFEKIDDSTTRYHTEQDFQFKGFMKIMAFLMPGAFKKQSMQYLKDFKAFAENQ